MWRQKVHSLPNCDYPVCTRCFFFRLTFGWNGSIDLIVGKSRVQQFRSSSSTMHTYVKDMYWRFKWTISVHVINVFRACLCTTKRVIGLNIVRCEHLNSNLKYMYGVVLRLVGHHNDAKVNKLLPNALMFFPYCTDSTVVTFFRRN